ncbi:MAG: peptide-methionine (S)-S-oxide reductase MsrA [Rubricoccaceae bacterium]
MLFRVNLALRALGALALGAALLAGCATEPPLPPRAPVAIDPAVADTAVFAGGCFWCMEGPFEALDGVGEVLSGYTGGTEAHPAYLDVAGGRTGHAEAVRVVFDRSRVSYETLLRTFWHNIDPFDGGGQFCDRGQPYRPGIFYRTDAQRRLAEAMRDTLEARFGRPVAAEITPAGAFYPAEDYHQDFYRREPARYRQYRQGCGRDARLDALWGERARVPSDVL